MSISGISGNPTPWQWHSQASDSIANTGSVSAGNMAAFFQSFSADLQSMLSQAGLSQAGLSQAGNTAGSSAPSQTAANQPMAGAHHHHHHSEGGSGATQGAASQMTAQIGQDPSGGSLTASGISHSASRFAADVMQALQAYGSTPSAAAGSTLLA